MGVCNLCFNICFFLRLLKRRFLTIIGAGAKAEPEPLLPQRTPTKSSASAGFSSASAGFSPATGGGGSGGAHGHIGELTTDWSSWGDDEPQASPEKPVDKAEQIEKRKIELMFASMEPDYKASATLVVEETPDPAPATRSRSARFQLQDTLASAELEEMADEGTAWEEDEIDVAEVRRLAQQQRKAQRLQQQNLRGKSGRAGQRQ